MPGSAKNKSWVRGSIWAKNSVTKPSAMSRQRNSFKPRRISPASDEATARARRYAAGLHGQQSWTDAMAAHIRNDDAQAAVTQADVVIEVAAGVVGGIQAAAMSSPGNTGRHAGRMCCWICLASRSFCWSATASAPPRGELDAPSSCGDGFRSPIVPPRPGGGASPVAATAGPPSRSRTAPAATAGHGPAHCRPTCCSIRFRSGSIGTETLIPPRTSPTRHPCWAWHLRHDSSVKQRAQEPKIRGPPCRPTSRPPRASFAGFQRLTFPGIGSIRRPDGK